MRGVDRDRSPILVTGLPRSGTSWVGKMLEASRAVTYVNEPLNPTHPPGRSPGVLAVSPDHQFQYICDDNDERWLPAFRRTVELRYGVAAELRRNRGAYDLARMARYYSAFTAGRLRGRRALLDDPYALFSTRWLVERVGARAVVLVRDPVGLVGSWRNLGWSFGPDGLLSQPLLLRDLIDEPKPLRDITGSDDAVVNIAVLWQVAYQAIRKFLPHSGIHLFCYDDIVRDPMSAFRQMYDVLDLPWSDDAVKRIEAATSSSAASNRGFAWSISGGVSRTAFRPMSGQQALRAQTGRLSEADVERVREITAGVAELYFPTAAEPT